MGRHAEPKRNSTTKQIAVGASVLMGGSVVPTIVSSPARAASVDQWDRIAACESGDKNTPGSGRWDLPYGHASSTGGLQIQLPTWNDYGGQEFASAPHLATKAEQIAVAERILAGQGPGAWVCNSPGHGIASGALTGERGDASARPEVPVPPKPVAPPPVKPSPKPSAPVSEPEDAEDGVYVVKRGDWLAKIARRLGTDGGWQRLYEINRKTVGPNPNLIFPDQKLRLPGHEAPEAPASKPTAPAKPKPDPKPVAPAPAPAYVMPVQGLLGDTLIVGAGGSMSRSAGGHSGLDISAPQGTTVRSVAAGLVVSINASGAAYGNHVVVKHADGKYTLYAHLSAISVNLGQSVGAGQQVGNVGSTGVSSGPHLHFEVRTHPTDFNSSIFLEPKAYLRLNGVTI